MIEAVAGQRGAHAHTFAVRDRCVAIDQRERLIRIERRDGSLQHIRHPDIVGIQER